MRLPCNSKQRGGTSWPWACTSGARHGAPSVAHWPSSAFRRKPPSDMYRSVSGSGSAWWTPRRSAGISSSWSPLTGEFRASSAIDANNESHNDSCQTPLSGWRQGSSENPTYPMVGVIAQNRSGVHRNPTPHPGPWFPVGLSDDNRICLIIGYFKREYSTFDGERRPLASRCCHLFSD